MLCNIDYNSKLEAIYKKYQSQNNESFALAYQPANVDVSTFPVDVLRYVEKEEEILDSYNRENILTLRTITAMSTAFIPTPRLIHGLPE